MIIIIEIHHCVCSSPIFGLQFLGKTEKCRTLCWLLKRSDRHLVRTGFAISPVGYTAVEQSAVGDRCRTYNHGVWINSSIRPPYVNGVVYLNDEAGHSSIRPSIFNHSKTLKLCYTILPFLTSIISNLHYVSPRRTTSGPLWRRNRSCYWFFERAWSQAKRRANDATPRCVSVSKQV